MPNRIIKESIRTSKSVNSMSDFQFRLWAYLITYVDDFGRGSADPEIIKGFVFPKRGSVTEKTIEKTLQELATMGSLILYKVDGDAYLCFPNWEAHQTVRNKKSKFPAPPDEVCEQVADTCKQMHANAPVIQSNPNPNPNTNPNPEIAQSQSADSVPPVIELPLNDGSLYPVTEEQCHEWAGLYPAVDVIQQLRNMLGWLNSNPSRRKTKAGIKRFVNSWLSKEQDKYHPATHGQNQSRSGATFMDMWREEYGGGS